MNTTVKGLLEIIANPSTARVSLCIIRSPVIKDKVKEVSMIKEEQKNQTIHKKRKTVATQIEMNVKKNEGKERKRQVKDRKKKKDGRNEREERVI